MQRLFSFFTRHDQDQVQETIPAYFQIPDTITDVEDAGQFILQNHDVSPEQVGEILEFVRSELSFIERFNRTYQKKLKKVLKGNQQNLLSYLFNITYHRFELYETYTGFIPTEVEGMPIPTLKKGVYTIPVDTGNRIFKKRTLKPVTPKASEFKALGVIVQKPPLKYAHILPPECGVRVLATEAFLAWYKENIWAGTEMSYLLKGTPEATVQGGRFCRLDFVYEEAQNSFTVYYTEPVKNKKLPSLMGNKFPGAPTGQTIPSLIYDTQYCAFMLESEVSFLDNIVSLRR